MRLVLGFPFVLSLVAASPLSFRSGTATATAYDYVVVGGGTCGLVVANRLSENSSISVLVIEAGDSVLDNTDVSDPDGYGRALGTAIDWQYPIVAQKYAGNSKHTARAGKAVGGTSTINGMAYTRAQNVQIDAWETIGNTGWNWNNLLPYYLKSEHYQIPNAAQIAAGASYTPSFHAFTGPLKVGFGNNTSSNVFASTLNSTYQNTGVPYSPDVSGGKMRGYNIYPRTIDTAANVREDAARAYYWPFNSRTNLQLVTNTVATQIIWAASNGSNATASGVKVTKADGTTQIITAKREVILSAGSLRSPQLLELSGIGNPDILSKYGIPVKVPLPGVGENLQDQMNNGLSYAGSSTTSYTGIGGYVGYINATDVFGSSTSSVASTVLSALPQYASTVAAASNNASKAANLQALFKVQHGLIFTSKVPIAEVLVYPSGTSFGSQYWALLPFARGSVHINSSSATTFPTINPNYYMLDWDAQGQTGVAKFIRKLFSTAPLKQLVSKETSPGLTTVPASASDATWTSWLRKNFRANYHFVSSAAMMPQASGGVVNPRLLVYGTSNVRVVDASVLPFQLCGHLMSTLYAVAERASDLIKADAA